MNNEIRMSQNRHYKTGIVIYDDEEHYYLRNGESLIFGIKRFAYNTDYIIRRELTQDNYNDEADAYVLELSTEETNIDTGSYFYDVALKKSSGELEMIIPCTSLEICRSVVRSDDIC